MDGIFFKNFPFIERGSSFPLTSINQYAFPLSTSVIKYGPSQFDDHLPNSLFWRLNGKIAFHTKSPTINRLTLTLLLKALATFHFCAIN